MDSVKRGNVPSDCHPRVEKIVEYWQRIHPKEGLPGRQHFYPADIPALLPNICLIDCPTPTSDFRFRLVGTRAEIFFGGDFTGRPFVDAYVRAEQSQAYADLLETTRDGLPRWRNGTSNFVENRESALIERVYLPLARNGTIVDIIVLFLLTTTIDADFVREPD